MKGKLYGIGVGPGDPELLTLKAKRILESVQCIAIPKTAMEKESLALSIIKSVVNITGEVFELIFPMSYENSILEKSWEEAIAKIKVKLDKGKDIAFITLGDPTVYSTYIYLHKKLVSEGFQCEIVSGITSFCASASRVGISLAENKETLAVIPSAYKCENLDNILDSFDNVVLMKVSGDYEEIIKKLNEKDLIDKAVQISRCGLEDEKIVFNLNNEINEKPSYFTTMIIKKKGVRD